MGSSVAAGGFKFSHASVGGTWYWTVRADNVRGAGQLYQVVDVTSPFGGLAASSIPIPGDVVLKMAESIQDMQAQLAPLIALVAPGTTTFNITVVEGGSTVVAATVPFQNAGAFGSFLTATATPSAAWLKSVPGSIVGVGKNEQGQFVIQVNPATLLATGSPYSGTVSLQDNRPTPTVIPLTFNVTVQPKPTISVDVTEVVLTYSLTTLAYNGPLNATVTNTGPAGSQLSIAAAKVQNLSAWLSFTPSSLGPLASGASAAIAFSFVPAGAPTVPGTYTETVRLTSTTATNSPKSVLVKLVVSA